jgi:3-oxoacyl-[acyl-carrier protein] reductase
MQLSDLKIIVTGGASGMGAHFAKRLHEAGAKVAAGDVNEAGLKELPAGIFTRKLNVADEADVEAFVGWANEAMGGLNGLINNAGILRDGLLVKKDRATGEVKKLSTADWNAVIGVNLTGATLMVREVVAKMATTGAKPGVIVNMSSVARHGNRGQSNYVSAKAALAANTVTWAREFAPFGIRVTCIAPGMVETPMTQGMNQKARDALVTAIPVGRIGLPDDLWLAAKFALECDYFNGRCIDVDGGLVMLRRSDGQPGGGVGVDNLFVGTASSPSARAASRSSAWSSTSSGRQARPGRLDGQPAASRCRTAISSISTMVCAERSGRWVSLASLVASKIARWRSFWEYFANSALPIVPCLTESHHASSAGPSGRPRRPPARFTSPPSALESSLPESSEKLRW